MKRREFFTKAAPSIFTNGDGANQDTRKTSAGLEPYVPSPSQPWNELRVLHLLRRTMFGVSRQQIQTALLKTPGEVVDMLITDVPAPQPPGTWVTEKYQSNQFGDITHMQELYFWWVKQMLVDTISCKERMTLFMHGLFTMEASKIFSPQFQYGYIKLLRSYALGNLREFVKKYTIEPAVLFYLNGRKNTRVNIDKTYAQVLLESFLMGSGNFTDKDVEEAARSFTGWYVKWTGSLPLYDLQATFDSMNFDNALKTLFGQSGIYDANKAIDIIFQQDATAKFICRKLYREFVCSNPDETIIDQLAVILRQNNFELKPVYSVLFKSAHFFDNAFIGSHVTNPYELLLSICRYFDLNSNTVTTQQLSWIYYSANTLGLQLLAAPKMSGFRDPGGWIDFNSLSDRWIATDYLCGAIVFQFDLYEHVKKYPDSNDAEKLVTDIIDDVICFPLSIIQKSLFVDKLLGGAPIYEWQQIMTQQSTATRQLRQFFKELFRLSEFQLS